jgi:hypothetical protein
VCASPEPRRVGTLRSMPMPIRGAPEARLLLTLPINVMSHRLRRCWEKTPIPVPDFGPSREVQMVPGDFAANLACLPTGPSAARQRTTCPGRYGQVVRLAHLP